MSFYKSFSSRKFQFIIFASLIAFAAAYPGYYDGHEYAQHEAQGYEQHGYEQQEYEPHAYEQIERQDAHREAHDDHHHDEIVDYFVSASKNLQ